MLTHPEEIEPEDEDFFGEPVEMPITDEIDLHGFSPKETRLVIIEYLREAAERGFREVRVVHGKGIGTQRRIIQAELGRNPFVESFKDAPANMGGLGATLVVLKKPDSISPTRSSPPAAPA